MPSDRSAFMQVIEEIYQSDAYHSLSIEGYSVSADLIERVRAGKLDPDHDGPDRQSPRCALRREATGRPSRS